MLGELSADRSEHRAWLATPGDMLGERSTMLGERSTMLGERLTMLGERSTMLGERLTMLGERSTKRRTTLDRGSLVLSFLCDAAIVVRDEARISRDDRWGAPHVRRLA